MSAETSVGTGRNTAIDAAKTAAIFGTLMIHASANGGFAWPVGSARWIAALFWGCLLRCAVPVFLMCSGALLLAPEKRVTIGGIYKKYIPRILAALFFWAAAYSAWSLLGVKLHTGVLEAAALKKALVDLVTFRHKSHLYYLHITLLVYALVPVSRLFAARADRKLMGYALGLWFVLGSVLPCVQTLPPFSLITGIPRQYLINLTWGGVGYGLLGYALLKEAPRRKPRFFAAVFGLGFLLTFAGTLAVSLRQGALYQDLIQGYAPGVVLQAAGLFGWCVSRYAQSPAPAACETVSKASFCIYLVHLFPLDLLAARGLSAGFYHPAWAVPVLCAVLFACGFAVWLVLRRIPVVRKYLI